MHPFRYAAVGGKVANMVQLLEQRIEQLQNTVTNALLEASTAGSA